MKKRLLVLCGVLAAGVGGLLLLRLWDPLADRAVPDPIGVRSPQTGSAPTAPRPLPAISRGAFDRIEVGMRQEEVEKVLGGPPGNYATKDVFYPPGGTVVWKGRTEYWLGNEGLIMVVFDDGGTLYHKAFTDVTVFDGGGASP
jgi:hypothetical protein